MPRTTPDNPAPEAVRCSTPGCYRKAHLGNYKIKLCPHCRYPAKYARENARRGRKAAPAAPGAPPPGRGDRVALSRRLRVDVIWAGPGPDDVRHERRRRLPAGTPATAVDGGSATADLDEPNFRGVVVELACGGRCVIDPEFLTPDPKEQS